MKNYHLLILLFACVYSSAMFSQTPYYATSDYYEVVFPGSDIYDTATGQDKSVYSVVQNQIYQVSAYFYPPNEIEENGKALVNELVENIVQTIPDDKLEKGQTVFNGREAAFIITEGFISYDMLVFTVYDKLFVVQAYAVMDKIDPAGRDLFFNSFKILDDQIELQKAKDEETRKKKEEMLKRREAMGRSTGQ